MQFSFTKDAMNAFLKQFVVLCVIVVVIALLFMYFLWPAIQNLIIKAAAAKPSKTAGQPFNVTVRVMARQDYTFTVEEKTSVRKLKKMISQKTKIPVISMRLKIRGITDADDEIKDNMTLGQYGFHAGKTPIPSLDLSIKGGIINYTLEHPEYQDMDDHDRMNYAAFMLQYDVEKNKEFVEGAKSSMCEMAQTATGVEGAVQRFFLCNASWEMVKRPQRLVNFLTFISFMLIVIMFVMWLAMIIIGAVGDALGKVWIAPVKPPTLFIMILTVCGIMALVHLVQFFYDRVVNSVENVGLNIK